MSLIDLKSYRSKSHLWRKIPLGPNRVLWKSRLLSNHGVSPSPCLSPMRGSLQRQVQSQGVHLPGSVLLHGLCPDHVSGEPTRYRGMSSGAAWQALPYRNQGASFPKYPGQCKQGQGLAHLCGPCTLANYYSTQTLQQRCVSRRPQRNRLRSGRHNYRLMHLFIPLGPFQEDQRSDQTPYLVRFARQYPIVHSHLRWKTPRGQHSGYNAHRSRLFLYHGQGLSGLHQAPSSFTVYGLLCYEGKIESQMPSSLFSSCGPGHWPDMRSDCYADGPKVSHGLSRQITPSEILRLRDRKESGFPYEQFHFTVFDHLHAIPESLAGGTVFQMDQTKSPDKNFLRHIRKCRKDSDMDCCVSLRARCKHEKTTEYTGQSLHNFTGPQCLVFRENTAFSTSCKTRLQKRQDGNL